jgi:tight adherence protein B
MRQRRAGRLVAALAVLGTALAITASAASAGGQESSDLVIREVDGTDPAGVQVTFFYGGDRDDLSSLTVRENGSQVDTSAAVPVQEDSQQGVVLLVDVSQSMLDNAALERAREAAAEYVEERAANEHVAVITFGNEVQILQDFTTNAQALEDAVGDIVIAEAVGTKLYDGLAAAAGLYKGSGLQPNVLLLSDGDDSSSELDRDGALSALADVDAAVFSVALASSEFEPDELAMISERTGGQAVSTDDATRLSSLFGDMHTKLGQQYVVTYPSQLESGTAAAELQMAVGADRAVAAYTPGSLASGADGVRPAAVAEPDGPDFLRGSTGLYLGVLLALIAASVIAYTLISVFTRDRSGLESALQPYAEGYVASSDDMDDDDESKGGLAQTQILQRAVALTGQIAQDRGVLPRIEAMLEQANLPLRAAEALFFYMATVVVGTLLLLVLTQEWLWALFGFVAVLLVPPAILSYLGNKRRKQFEAMLPDTLQLLSSTLRAGYSLMQGVEAVSQEVSEPMGRELRRVVTEARLGRPLEQALEGVAERMASGDFAWAVMAIRIQREVGGNLSELLLTVAETMTQRERLRRDVAALTAEGKISAIVLGILPVGLMVIMYAINPDYIEVLFDRTIGNFMLGGGLLLMLVGFYWMKKTIDIDI